MSISLGVAWSIIFLNCLEFLEFDIAFIRAAFYRHCSLKSKTLCLCESGCYGRGEAAAKHGRHLYFGTSSRFVGVFVLFFCEPACIVVSH